MCDVVGCPVILVQEIINLGTSMLMRIASLEEMILASCISDGILGDVIHWKVDMFYFLS